MTQRLFPAPVTPAPYAAAATARLQTPREQFGALFEQVQVLRVFPDGKTFADAIPRVSPQSILADFAAEAPRSIEDLRAFVTARFDLPPAARTVPQDSHGGLRDHIAALWPRLTRPADAPETHSSLIPLPEPYVVPGGRFREIYYWDSYFTMLGLACDGHHDLVDAMVLNFISLVERFGHIPNGTRTYYLSRSQPPFLAMMAGLSRAHGRAADERRLSALAAEHAWWMTGEGTLSEVRPACDSVVRLPGGDVLNRYWDTLDTPRDESCAEDIATAGRANRPAAVVCRDLRAGAASGWDFSSRWLGDGHDIATIRTTRIIPVDLNSLLWQLEKTLAEGYAAAGLTARSRHFATLADRRAAAIRTHLWADCYFADYDTGREGHTGVLSAATLYPLFVGLADQAQADAVAATVRDHMLARGGLRTTTQTTDQQWDMPNGWAPLQWIAIVGLDRYGHAGLARDIARRWLDTVATTWRETGRLLEKYDIETLQPGGGGEYPVQDGFGWTNGVTRAILARYPDLDDPDTDHKAT